MVLTAPVEVGVISRRDGVTWRRCEGCGFEVRSGPWSVPVEELSVKEYAKVSAYRSGVCAHIVDGHWFCVWCADIWDDNGPLPLYGSADWASWWRGTPVEELETDLRYRCGTRTWHDATDEGGQ